MKPPYLEVLKDFVEGKRDLREWPAWWQENEHSIEEYEGRTFYLKLKHYWQEGACAILKQHGIKYIPNKEINWDRCKECGEILFIAIPHKTTPEQIREFAHSSSLLDKEQIELEGWIHPGIFCPNGCTRVLISYKSNSDE